MPPLPDVEALVIWKLNQDLVAVGGVHGAFPTDPTYPLVVVVRIGGIPKIGRWLDDATLQVDIWADTKAEASDLAAIVFANLMETEGTLDTGEVSGTITGISPAGALRWSTDERNEIPRRTFTVGVTAHP